jgi:hypothetical protein
MSTGSNPTNKSEAHWEVVYRYPPRVHQEVDRQVHRVDQDASNAVYQECNHEVDQIVNKADFKRRLPRQKHLPMTTGCKIYFTEQEKALHRAQTAQARMNLVSITILEKLRCSVSANETTHN